MLDQTGLTAGRGVPEACGAVPRRRRHLLAVGAKGDVVDVALVSAQDAVLFHQVHVPDPHRAVGAAGHQAGAIGGERRHRTKGWPGTRSTPIKSPVWAFQRRSVASYEAVTTRVPFGLKRTCFDHIRMPAQDGQRLPRAPSQSRPVWSNEAVATRLPSGLKATAGMAVLCPARTASNRPVAASQRRGVLSG